MPKFTVDYIVETVFAGTIEIEANSEEAAIKKFEDMPLTKLESGDGQIESWIANISSIKEKK